MVSIHSFPARTQSFRKCDPIPLLIRTSCAFFRCTCSSRCLLFLSGSSLYLLFRCMLFLSGSSLYLLFRSQIFRFMLIRSLFPNLLLPIVTLWDPRSETRNTSFPGDFSPIQKIHWFSCSRCPHLNYIWCIKGSDFCTTNSQCL